MPVANSYQRNPGPVVLLSQKKQQSYHRLSGPTVLLLTKRYESYQRITAWLPILDSTNTVQPRIQSYAQRPGGNEGDVSGLIYNSNGGAITFVSMEYSQVGSSGPWLPLTVLPGDPLYNFPSPGIPAGSPFNIPVEITDNYTGNIWFRMVINGPLGNAEHINGPYSFTYVNPLPDPPGSITVPERSIVGTFTIDWTAGALADSYELQEATESDFSDAQTIYSGTDLSYTVSDREPGTYYYRVRSVNIYGTSDWLEGSNGTEVPLPSVPSSVIVPETSETGEYKIAWAAVDGADGYEVQEDIDPGFANPKVVYNGSETSVTIRKNERGTFYYRVRAWRL